MLAREVAGEQARSEREASTMKWFDEAFGSWLGAVGEEKAKEVFWRMAAGKVLMDPKRLPTDREAEINPGGPFDHQN